MNEREKRGVSNKLSDRNIVQKRRKKELFRRHFPSFFKVDIPLDLYYNIVTFLTMIGRL